MNNQKARRDLARIEGILKERTTAAASAGGSASTEHI
jgi:hypothetical protein